MPSLLLLFVISLTVASQQARDKSRPAKVATTDANGKPTTAPSKIVAVPVALPDAATPPATPVAIALIEADARGLLMPSETDAPLVVKYWPSQKTELLAGDVAALAEQKLAAPVAIKTVAEFFKNAATIEEWMKDDEKAEARRFAKLIETLETQLENPRVYLFGERERTVVVIGKLKGGFGGIVTLVVET